MKKIETKEQFNNINVEYIMSKLNKSEKKNKKILKNYFGEFLFEKNDNNENLLHIFVNKYYSLTSSKNIKLLLELGVNPNELNNNNENFIQVAIKNYRITLVKNLIKYALDYNLDVNHQNNQGETILHNFIDSFFGIDFDITFISMEFYDIIIKIIDSGFDINLKDKKGRDVVSILKQAKFYNDRNKIINYIIEKYHLNIESNDTLTELKKYGECIPKNNTITWINRDREMIDLRRGFYNNIMLVKGKEGSGRSTSIERLIGELPERYEEKLNNYDYLKTNIDKILNNCKSIGGFKLEFIKLMKKCSDNYICLLIEDIDDISKLKLSNDDIDDINLFIELYLEKNKLKLIFTSKKGKADLFFNDELKKTIKEAEIKEPEDEKLIEIIDYKINEEFNIIKLDWLVGYNNKKIFDSIYHKLLILISKENNIKDNSISRVQVINDSINYLRKHNISLDSIKCSILNNQYITDEIKEEIKEIFKPIKVNDYIESYSDLEEKVNNSLKLVKEK